MIEWTDWNEWHRQYDDPTSSLARRLEVVKRCVGSALDIIGRGPISLLSLCAGDGRDVIPVVAAHPRRADVTAVLVELDPPLADTARRQAAFACIPELTVRCADAGDVTTWSDVLPVDLLMLCGIFGNISEADIQHVVSSIGSLVRSGGVIVWTRGGSQPDLRQHIRDMFVSAGCDELSFAAEPNGFGVGMARVRHGSTRVDARPKRLFTFMR